MLPKRNTVDPRYYQIAALSSLLVMGVAVFDIQILPTNVVTIIVIAVGTQMLLGMSTSDSIRSIPSALISALSLCLLLRTNEIAIAILASFVAIGSKRFLSYRGQHLFNPTAFALVTVSLVFEGAWISPGQWGHEIYLLILIAGIGTLVSRQASRIDISLGFLLGFASLCFLRAFYLGDPLTIPLHQLSNGALLIFTFFMISDPRTSPRSRPARFIFAMIVAIVSACLGFVFYQPNGPIYALVLCAPIVPLLNRYFPANAYEWPNYQRTTPQLPTPNGVHHA